MFYSINFTDWYSFSEWLYCIWLWSPTFSRPWTGLTSDIIFTGWSDRDWSGHPIFFFYFSFQFCFTLEGKFIFILCERVTCWMWCRTGMECGNNCCNKPIFGVKTTGFCLFKADFLYFFKSKVLLLFPHWHISINYICFLLTLLV